MTPEHMKSMQHTSNFKNRNQLLSPLTIYLNKNCLLINSTLCKREPDSKGLIELWKIILINFPKSKMKVILFNFNKEMS